MNDERHSSGLHPDPADPAFARPDRSSWTTRESRAHAGTAGAAFRAGLLVAPSTDVRASVLDDLSQYFGFSPDECVRRCVDWERWAVEEWSERERVTPTDIADFYHHTQSWAFDLLWYAYLQAEHYRYPVSAAIGDSVGPGSGRTLLDFGSGVGVTAQMFAELGFDVELADISTTLMAFARFRLERRGIELPILDLNTQSLPIGRYDVITAIDTLVHIPDLAVVIDDLYRSMKPGGLLFANFDVRPATVENHSILYSDDRPLRRMLHRAGFVPEESLDGMIVRYRHVPRSGARYWVRRIRDAVELGPLRKLYRWLKRRRHQLARN